MDKKYFRMRVECDAVFAVLGRVLAILMRRRSVIISVEARDVIEIVLLEDVVEVEKVRRKIENIIEVGDVVVKEVDGVGDRPTECDTVLREARVV